MRVQDARRGLGGVPGTAAEILDDDVRPVICNDKLEMRTCLDLIETAHSLGLRPMATIMPGHVESPLMWAVRLRHPRGLQERTTCCGTVSVELVRASHRAAPLAPLVMMLFRGSAARRRDLMQDQR